MRIIRVDRVHTALCGTEFTRARWLQVATPPHSYHGPCQIFTSASHHIASQVKQTRGTQCAAQRSALTVGSWQERECHALFGPHVQSAIAQSSSIRIETTPGSGLGLIQIESGLGECVFSVNAFKPDSIRFNAHWMSKCEHALVKRYFWPATWFDYWHTVSTWSTCCLFEISSHYIQK